MALCQSEEAEVSQYWEFYFCTPNLLNKAGKAKVLLSKVQVNTWIFENTKIQKETWHHRQNRAAKNRKEDKNKGPETEGFTWGNSHFQFLLLVPDTLLKDKSFMKRWQLPPYCLHAILRVQPHFKEIGPHFYSLTMVFQKPRLVDKPPESLHFR